MLIGMRDMTRGVMLPRWPWKIMHTRGESILPISGPKVSGGKLVAALWKLYSVFPAIRGELLETGGPRKISGFAVDGQRSIHLIFMVGCHHVGDFAHLGF